MKITQLSHPRMYTYEHDEHSRLIRTPTDERSSHEYRVLIFATEADRICRLFATWDQPETMTMQSLLRWMVTSKLGELERDVKQGG